MGCYVIIESLLEILLLSPIYCVISELWPSFRTFFFAKRQQSTLKLALSLSLLSLSLSPLSLLFP